MNTNRPNQAIAALPRHAAFDTREAQCVRVADCLDARPRGATSHELDAACDVGSITKIFSNMPRMGYVSRKERGHEQCADGSAMRHVRVCVLIALRNAVQRQRCLDLAIEGAAA